MPAPCWLVLGCLAVLVFSCDTREAAERQENFGGQIKELRVERGLLTAISIEDEGGRITTFRLHPTIRTSIDIVHLEAHKQLRVPVTLFLRNHGDGLVVVAIGD
jgi:hypothetical protein